MLPRSRHSLTGNGLEVTVAWPDTLDLRRVACVRFLSFNSAKADRIEIRIFHDEA